MDQFAAVRRSKDGQPIRYLIVDDSVFARKNLGRIIESFGGQIAGEAGDGLTAISEFDRLKPDIVLMDINMPGLSSIDAAHQMRKHHPNTKILFLEASDEALVRRFSETRRPHPLDKNAPVSSAISAERKRLDPIRNLADEIIDTSKFNVHELRQHIIDKFQRGKAEKTILISCVSFGFKNGVPPDVDLVFDVRFLPNPHFVPEFRPHTGLHPKVAAYIRKFPQTREFIKRISQLLIYLLPHYIREGKSYLTIGFGCTGGQHRSVMIAEDVRKHLEAAGYNVKATHRDAPKT